MERRNACTSRCLWCAQVGLSEPLIYPEILGPNLLSWLFTTSDLDPLFRARSDGQIRFAGDQAGRAVEWRDVMRRVHEVTGRSSGDVW